VTKKQDRPKVSEIIANAEKDDISDEELLNYEFQFATSDSDDEGGNKKSSDKRSRDKKQKGEEKEFLGGLEKREAERKKVGDEIAQKRKQAEDDLPKGSSSSNRRSNLNTEVEDETKRQKSKAVENKKQKDLDDAFAKHTEETKKQREKHKLEKKKTTNGDGGS